jgi:hypothetical protein
MRETCLSPISLFIPLSVRPWTAQYGTIDRSWKRGKVWRMARDGTAEKTIMEELDTEVMTGF